MGKLLSSSLMKSWKKILLFLIISIILIIIPFTIYVYRKNNIPLENVTKKDLSPHYFKEVIGTNNTKAVEKYTKLIKDRYNKLTEMIGKMNLNDEFKSETEGKYYSLLKEKKELDSYVEKNIFNNGDVEKNNLLEFERKLDNAIISANELLPYFCKNKEEFKKLYENTLSKKKELLTATNELNDRVIGLEKREDISYDSYLALSTVESTLYSINDSLLKQADSSLEKYENTIKVKDSPYGDIVSLSGALSCFSMIEKNLNYCNAILDDFIFKGSFTFNEKQSILNNKKSVISKMDKLVKVEGTFGYELYTFGKGNIEDAQKLEKMNYYSYACLCYDLADIFLDIAPDWMNVKDKEGEKTAASVTETNDVFNQSIDKLSSIDKQLKDLERENIYMYNIRELAYIEYRSWTAVGSGLFSRHLELKEIDSKNWSKTGSLTYYNIDVGNKMLSKIEALIKEYKK